MGTQLLRLVEARAMGGAFAELSPNAYAVLLVMALNAHDTGTSDAPARTYFRGWEHIARAGLRRSAYDAATHQAVKRTMRELTDAGLVKPVGRRNGIRTGLAMYELHL